MNLMKRRKWVGLMLIESAPIDATWSQVARIVFWGRDVELGVWRAGILAAHRSYLPQSVKSMSNWNFIRFLGRKQFISHWPEIRQVLDVNSPDVARLDAAWSYAATGTFNMPPQAALVSLPGRRREVLDVIVHQQGVSIYDIAKVAKIAYRRVFDHVIALVNLGLVRKRIDEHGPRRIARLYTLRGNSKKS